MTNDLLPKNAKAMLRALSRAQARLLGIDMDVVRRAAFAATCPAHLLPWLAWDRSVDEYLESWPEANRRAVIAGSYDYHKVKGTPYALKRALASLDFQTTVTEWFQYGGAPYRFRVRVTKQGNSTLSQEEMRALKRLINSAKNVRSMLDAIETSVTQQSPAPFIAAWGARRTRTVTLYPEAA